MEENAEAIRIIRLEEQVKALQSSWITRAEFEPVRNIVYGLVTVILMSVIGALVGLVITGGGPK